jgi:DNA-binding LacI/PurR family transcriptional regulator
VTLRDSACLLNLSPSSISRALTQPDMVADSTRKRGHTAVKQHGYQPNGVARPLRQGQARFISLLVSDMQNPFYSTVVKAVERAAAQRGFSVVM